MIFTAERSLTVFRNTLQDGAILWCTTPRRQHLLPRSALRIGTDGITLSTNVRNFGIFIDADLSGPTFNGLSPATCCFTVLRQLRSIRRSVPSSCFRSW